MASAVVLRELGVVVGVLRRGVTGDRRVGGVAELLLPFVPGAGIELALLAACLGVALALFLRALPLAALDLDLTQEIGVIIG